LPTIIERQETQSEKKTETKKTHPSKISQLISVTLPRIPGSIEEASDSAAKVTDKTKRSEGANAAKGAKSNVFKRGPANGSISCLGGGKVEVW